MSTGAAWALLTAADLREHVRPPGSAPADCDCARLVCPGWESVSSPVGEPLLERLGSLRAEGDDEPTLTEQHSERSSYWSPNAPIATAFFPYNRCEVWLCRRCARGFLQYTEYGGYYVDHRLREIDPGRVV